MKLNRELLQHIGSFLSWRNSEKLADVEAFCFLPRAPAEVSFFIPSFINKIQKCHTQEPNLF